MEENIIPVLEKYKKKLENEYGYKVLYIGLYGSQNYNCHDELSDIDARAIVLPDFNDLVFRKEISKVYTFDEGEVDVKDLITYCNVAKKGNPAFIEPLQSEYWLGDEKIRNLFYKLPANLNAIFGTMIQKQKVLTHEFPSKREEFTKWGFDPKQLHHILRLRDLLQSIINNSNHKSFLTYDDFPVARELIYLKRNYFNFTKEKAIQLADEYVSYAKRMMDSLKDYKFEEFNVDDEIIQYLREVMKIGY